MKSFVALIAVLCLVNVQVCSVYSSGLCYLQLDISQFYLQSPLKVKKYYRNSVCDCVWIVLLVCEIIFYLQAQVDVSQQTNANVNPNPALGTVGNTASGLVSGVEGTAGGVLDTTSGLVNTAGSTVNGAVPPVNVAVQGSTGK
jgi:hypothetical protein